MTQHRFQFTIASAMLATFWVAIGLSVWYYPSYSMRIGRHTFIGSEGIAACVTALCLAMAIGAIIGRQRQVIWMALIAAAIAAGFVVFCIFAMDI
ncbi:MAG: hypothetical protein K8T91_17135 [Planctomycetes bacterium]|nr:hypothetical protein [Planctomycetota bacterium]